MNNRMDEIALIDCARRGDLEAFNQLVLAYQDLVYSQAYRILGEQEEAEDAAQETFIAAYRNLRTFRDGSFKCWLVRIVTNTCYDELRRRKRRPMIPLEPLNNEEEEVESPYWIADPGETPEARVERAELGRLLRRALDALPPEFRAVAVLVDVMGLNYEEAAQAAGVPLGTVKSRLARARLELRFHLQLASIRSPGFQLERREGIGQMHTAPVVASSQPHLTEINRKNLQGR